MADITMCENKTCPLRAICYRATAKPDPYWQSFSEKTITVETDSAFWELMIDGRYNIQVSKTIAENHKGVNNDR